MCGPHQSGMLTRLIQEYPEEESNSDRIGDLTELSYDLRDRSKDKVK